MITLRWTCVSCRLHGQIDIPDAGRLDFVGTLTEIAKQHSNERFINALDVSVVLQRNSILSRDKAGRLILETEPDENFPDLQVRHIQ